MVSKRVVDHVVDQLAAQGVTHLFGVDGANIEDLYDAARLSPVHAVLAKHQLPLTVVLFNNNAHAMCVTREQLFFESPRSLRSCPPDDERYSHNRFTRSRPGAGLAAMFPGLPSVDVTEAAALPGALRYAIDHDGPSVVSIECSADEIPPFAPFIAAGEHLSHHEEMRHDVAART
jgi:acetolactate synthase I/II/III large subunit